ncbi:hypothetical protein MNBD_GAMMA24-1900 [hydrothermal vent metagenome]|uniref:DUF2914 domain-containing protein n=1 Tax=hydrothermal vent metagenome TaxID=652676 RepID=A0A3B1BLN8_9ZZZZ
MKLKHKLICTLVTGLLLGSPAWAENGNMQMDKQAPAEHDMSSMHEQSHNKMQEQAGDAGDTGIQKKAMNEPMPVEQSGFSRGSVVRSVFTSAVKDREPTDNIKQLDTRSDKVIYYTELRDMAGQTATHRWEYNGKVMAEVKFNVKGARWRVWSSKRLVPGWTGEWKVSVLNGANEVISEDVLTYSQATAKPGEGSAPSPVKSMQGQ